MWYLVTVGILYWLYRVYHIAFTMREMMEMKFEVCHLELRKTKNASCFRIVFSAAISACEKAGELQMALALLGECSSKKS